MSEPLALDNGHAVSPAVAAFWRAYCAHAGVDPATPLQVWHFGASAEMAHELADLVVNGPKRATASLADTNARFPHNAPVPGGYSVVTEFDGTPRAVIRTTWLDTRPLEDTDRMFAWDEGEGDRTLADWLDGHRAYFKRECESLGIAFHDRIPVVLERFELLWPLLAVPTLPLSRCTLREWRRDDVPALLRHAGNRNVQRNMHDLFPHPYTERAAREWCDGGWRRMGHVWAIEVDGEAVGGGGVSPDHAPYSCSAEFGYWLGEPYWGRGIATEVAGALADYALKLHGITRVYATVHAHNTASMRVLEKNGFTREGLMAASTLKDGRPIDRVLYAKVRADRSWP